MARIAGMPTPSPRPRPIPRATGLVEPPLECEVAAAVADAVVEVGMDVDGVPVNTDALDVGAAVDEEVEVLVWVWVLVNDSKTMVMVYTSAGFWSDEKTSNGSSHSQSS
jgi:hypothetical protein